MTSLPERLSFLISSLQELTPGQTGRICITTACGDVFTLRVSPQGLNLHTYVTHQDSSLRFVTIDALFVSTRENMLWLCELLNAVGILGPFPTVSITKTHRTLRDLQPITL